MEERWGSAAVIAPMPNELRPVVQLLGLERTDAVDGVPAYSGRAGDTDVVAIRTGIGPERAYAATTRLLASRPVERVVVTGIAGGVAPVSAVGDLVVPEEVLDAASGDRFRATAVGGIVPAGVIRTGGPDDYALDDRDIERFREAGISALDMETAAVARACSEHDVPWLAFRAISDMAGDASLGPVVMSFVDAEGRPRPGPALRHLLTHPTRIPRFVRLGRDAERAATAAAAAAVASVRAGGARDHGRR